MSNEVISGEPGSTGSGSPGAEELRLRETRTGTPWRAWGPYLSERQWGTVREDYSDGGDAWSYFTHDQARSRAYRWGEDGLAGISDDKQRLCLALALWNERDPILKERLFGLTNAEGNHGEDVKEYYFYVDNVPTHSYQRYLYKYPQAEFPYNDLVAVNRERSRQEFEYELIDTGIFDAGELLRRRGGAREGVPGGHLLPRHRAQPLGRATAVLHVLPTLWFRNTWSWGDRGAQAADRPGRRAVPGRPRRRSPARRLLPVRRARRRSCSSATTRRTRRARSAAEPTTRFPKDGIGDHVIARRGHRQSRRRGHQGRRARPAAGARRRPGLGAGPPHPAEPRSARGAARPARTS